MIYKLHVNLGHPCPENFVKVLKAAQAKPEILIYVRQHFRCPECSAHKKPAAHRRVALPKTYQFNRV
eukprot:4013366-Pyramimonas_sp.AAC.1